MESDYVSKNLHKWVDLVFGYKQRGREAVSALNMFVHVTYEGSVDLDSIIDPIEKESIIAQIQNFGQIPSRLEKKPYPAKNAVVAMKDLNFDVTALPYLSHLTPPLCVIGLPHKSYLLVSGTDTCQVGMAGQSDSSVGDMCLVKGQILGVGKTCCLFVSFKKYLRFGGSNNGVSIHVTRQREVNRVLTIHDGMHSSPITAAKLSKDGQWLVTGCMDSTVRVWKYNGSILCLKTTFCGHDKGKITCIDVSTEFGTIVTGGADGNALLWDLRTLTFLRKLRNAYFTVQESLSKAVTSISINHKNGNIFAVIESTLNLFDVNGNSVGRQILNDTFSNLDMPSYGVATDCPEWSESGIVAVTGHQNGNVRLWGLNYESESLVMRHILQSNPHSCSITCLRLIGNNQNILLVGDKSGKMSICKTLQLDTLSKSDLSDILQHLPESNS